MLKILNTNLKKVQERLSKRKLQRLSVELACGTNLELCIIPLGDDWEIDRMIGTDKSFCAIGIVNYGFYPFRLEGNIGVGYVASKLGLPFAEAEELTEFLNQLKIKFYDEE